MTDWNNIVDQLITPEPGKLYLLRRDGKKYLSITYKATTHWRFINLASGREILIKSRLKVLGEAYYESNRTTRLGIRSWLRHKQYTRARGCAILGVVHKWLGSGRQ